MLELHSDELRGHHAISGTEKKGKWAKFKHDVFFNTTLGSYPRIYLPNNLNWIVSKMVGEKLLKFEHTRWHVIPKKHSLCTSQASNSMTLCSNKSLCAHWFDYVRLLAAAKFCCRDKIFRKKWFVPATSHIATTCYCILWLSVPTFYTYLQKNGVFWSSLLMWSTHVALILQIFLEALLGTYLSTWSINSLLCGSISMDRGH